MQLTTEAAFLSLIVVAFTFVLIGVCPNFILAVLVHLNWTVQGNVLRAYVIEGPFQMVKGDCCRGLLTFTWSIQDLLSPANIIFVV